MENSGGEICDWATELWFIGVTGAVAPELLERRMCPERMESDCPCLCVSVKEEPVE